MKTFDSRRRRNIRILAAVALLLIAADVILSVSLRAPHVLSGWILFSLVVLLALYNVRKKLPFLPLGSSSAWLQVHIYAGLLAVLLFVLHVRWRIPNGVFESILALLFVAVAASGIVGLIMSRIFARRLTTRGAEVIYERIPVFQRRLHLEVEQLVMSCLADAGSTALSHLYLARLKPFFEKPRNFWQHLMQSHRARHRLLVEIESHERYLNDAEKKAMREIADRVRAKDDLDYQYAHQASLKYWLFAHVPLTYALLVFIVFHVVLVYAFSGDLN
ncbi:MAG: hypothetical protein HYS13_15880 [Planctomycetia bacterium]|nr:hypothetical protein [Planctomycetia bacterium]